jgi:hypothetical protein
LWGGDPLRGGVGGQTPTTGGVGGGAPDLGVAGGEAPRSFGAEPRPRVSVANSKSSIAFEFLSILQRNAAIRRQSKHPLCIGLGGPSFQMCPAVVLYSQPQQPGRERLSLSLPQQTLPENDATRLAVPFFVGGRIPWVRS